MFLTLTSLSDSQLYFTLQWPEDKDNLWKKASVAVEKKTPTHTHEFLGPVTRLILDVALTEKSEEHLTVRSDREKVIRQEILTKELAFIQRAIASLLEGKEGDATVKEDENLLECYCLKESAAHFRLVWPNLFVAREKGEELVNRIKLRVAEKAAESSHEFTAIDITGETYARGFTRMLGAVPATVGSTPPASTTTPIPCVVRLLAIYDAQGVEEIKDGVRKKVVVTSRESVEATCAFNGALWRPSNWKEE